MDWALGARLINRLEVESNRGLDAGGQDALVTKAVEAGLVLDAETKRALFSADLGIAAQYHIGEDPDFEGEGRVDPNLRLGHRYRGKTYIVESALNLSLQSTDATQTSDTGTIEADATQLTAGGSVRLTQALNAQNRLIGEIEALLIDFDEDLDSLIANQRYRAAAAWERDLTRTETVDLTGTFTYFAADTEAQTRTQILELTAGVTAERTPRHTIRLRLGPTFVRAYNEDIGTGVAFTGTVDAEAGFDYELASLLLGFEGSHRIEPSSVGAAQRFIRASGRARYAINPRHAVSGQVSYLRRAPISGSGSTFQGISFNPAYTMLLTENSRLSLGYLFRLNRNSETGTGTGHRVTLTLTQDFDFID